MRSGEPLSHLVSFDSGAPDADLNWTLRDSRGYALASGVMTPAVDALSASILISALANTLDAGSIVGSRELSWNYVTGGTTVSSHYRYQLEEFLPFGISTDGVRRKLGVDDLTDEEINLSKAYLAFDNQAGEGLLDTLLASSAYTQLVIADAIEATAALALIPTMVVRVAKQESSGTNQFVRQDVDWGAITSSLQTMIGAGLGVVNPSLTADTSNLFLLVTLAGDLFPG